MKTLKTTLGLFLLSAFLFSFAPQQPVTADDTNTAEELIQLQKVYESGEQIQPPKKGRGEE